MALKDTVKPWFVTGAYPTQSQFYQWMDSILWTDDAIAIAKITGLQTLLNTIITLAQVQALYREVINLISDGIYIMAPGLIITGIVIDSPVDITLRIGTTLGGNDILDDLAITGGTPEPITLTAYAKTEKTIYFSGIAASTDIIILKNTP